MQKSISESHGRKIFPGQLDRRQMLLGRKEHALDAPGPENITHSLPGHSRLSEPKCFQPVPALCRTLRCTLEVISIARRHSPAGTIPVVRYPRYDSLFLRRSFRQTICAERAQHRVGPVTKSLRSCADNLLRGVGNAWVIAQRER